MSSDRKIKLKSPSIISWQGKDVYVYAVESSEKKTTKSDLEFVIYIPIQNEDERKEVSLLIQDLEPKPEKTGEESHKSNKVKMSSIKMEDFLKLAGEDIHKSNKVKMGSSKIEDLEPKPFKSVEESPSKKGIMNLSNHEGLEPKSIMSQEGSFKTKRVQIQNSINS